MRVLHVLEATLGGARQYVRDIVTASPFIGADVALAYSMLRADSGFKQTLERAEAAGWYLIPVPMKREISPTDDIMAIANVRGIIRRWKPDVIHGHSSKGGGVARIAARLVRGGPATVYSPHAIAANISRRYLALEKLCAPLTTLYGAVSDSELQELVDLLSIAPERVRVVYPSLDPGRLRVRDRSDARRELGLPDGEMILGVGRLADQKNPLAFIDLVAKVRAERPTAYAIWVGDGELRGRVEAEATSHGLANAVRVVGWTDRVPSYIAAADVIVSTARYESFGYVVAEALAMERPVVATRITGTTDVMSGALSAYTYQPGNLGQGAVLVRSLLENPARAAAVAAAASEQVRRAFSEQRMGAALLQMYTDAIAIRNRGGVA